MHKNTDFTGETCVEEKIVFLKTMKTQLNMKIPIQYMDLQSNQHMQKPLREAPRAMENPITMGISNLQSL